MKTTWKFLSRIIAVFFCAVTIWAQQNPAPVQKNGEAPELKNFPALDIPEAVYKKVEKNYFFEDNGACEFRQKTELRVNTLFAMNELCGETFIVYNPKFQRVKINAAYTIMADGTTRVDVPENAFNTVLPRCAADAPAFNFLQELVITHTALEPGATIFLDYSIFFSAHSRTFFDEYPDMPFPCERLILNFNGSSTEYFNVPARSREAYFNARKTIPVIYPGMPSGAPRNLCATEHLELRDLGKKILSSLLNDKMTEDEKRATLIRFVQTQISTVPIPSELLLESDLRENDEVLGSAYGTPLEKVRLLWTMLSKGLGIDSKIIHEADDDTFFLETDSGERISVLEKNMNPKKISAEARCELSDGKEITRGTAVLTSSELDAKKAVEDLLTPGQKMLEAEWLPGRRLVYECERELPFRDGILLWQVPVSAHGIAELDFETLPRVRKSELRIPVQGEDFSETYSYKICLPENWILAGNAQATNIQNPVGGVSFFVMQDGSKIVVSKSLNLNKTTISPEEYPQFRALMVAWFEPSSNRVLFKKKDPSPSLPEKK